MEPYAQPQSPQEGYSPASSTSNNNYSSNTASMSSKASDATKPSKRKGTRSVSTLTPSQLARKRANDREAQRAIRARTKEHIENLERELDELRSYQSRDKTVQDLLRRNKSLEDELRRLRDTLGLPNTSAGSGMYQSCKSPSVPTLSQGPSGRSHELTPTQAYHDNSSRNSPYGQQPSPVMDSSLPPYSHIGDAGDNWSPHVQCSIPSAVSSPASSGGDDFGNSNYFPTSAPAAILERTGIPAGMNSPASSVVSGKMGFEDIKSEYGISVVPVTASYHPQQPAPWNVYPMYYPASPATM
ncbi:hypothetical protein Micbo1qcDRAFT_67454 [Microdochium bolleyi]|uniref:BZIP domain-containing protein n=1 Tax=Microdochium bolleyi TaxID=196109 RepID=A0A136J1A3_9PEZI|nr:hypothetical protein Micbo1qcDRAFT_67454 [Microdochium bolleyi]